MGFSILTLPPSVSAEIFRSLYHYNSFIRQRGTPTDLVKKPAAITVHTSLVRGKLRLVSLFLGVRQSLWGRLGGVADSGFSTGRSLAAVPNSQPSLGCGDAAPLSWH